MEDRKRIRLPHDIPHDLRKQLVRTARVIATVEGCHKVYENPEGVGGDSLTENDNYAERARRGDQTILHDFLISARDEF
jgi:hypothetical protein